MLNPVAPPPLRGPSLFRQACLVGGEWAGAASAETMSVANPAAGAVIGRLLAFSAMGTHGAAAAAALPAWRALLAKQRPPSSPACSA